MIVIGLTGVLGSGKSTAARLLGKQGLDVIDIDALAKESLGWEETQKEIKKVFGEKYVVGGKVDVESLRDVVFKKGEDLRRLEAIIHPLVRKEAEKRIEALAKKGVGVVIVDHPLLFETNFALKVDKVVVVSAEMETIKERLEKRGMQPDDVERRLSFQIPLKEKKARADHVVCNDGTEDQLAVEVGLLVGKITKWEVAEHAS